MLLLRMARRNARLCKHGTIMGREKMTADKGEGTEAPGGWMGPTWSKKSVGTKPLPLEVRKTEVQTG